MSEDKKPFTVNDRRKFNPEGESRTDDASAVDTAPPETTAAAEPARPEPDHEDHDHGPMIPTDLPGLVVMLATQASMMLAPQEGAPDLDGARAFIALLEMLQEKTKGNRTADEDRLLDDVLYQLRMAFVSIQRRA